MSEHDEHDEQGEAVEGTQTSPFDAIRHVDDRGNAWWR